MSDNYDFVYDILVVYFPVSLVLKHFDSFIGLHYLWIDYEFHFHDDYSIKILCAKFRRHCYDYRN